MLRRMAAVVFAVSCLLGSAAAANPSEEDALAEHLEKQFNLYVTALIENDSASVQQVVSAEKLQRYANAQGNGLDSVRFTAVVSREKTKLTNTFGTQLADGHRFKVLNYSSLDNGNVLKASFTIDGVEIPKPVYFVKDGQDYKINFNVPESLSQSLQPYSLDTYRAENEGNVQRFVGCGIQDVDYGAFVSVPPQSCTFGFCSAGHRDISCPNMCGGWAGSQFYGGGYVIGLCDYNTWGRDVWFDVYGNGRCNDHC
jgi:hypothetical protein